MNARHELCMFRFASHIRCALAALSVVVACAHGGQPESAPLASATSPAATASAPADPAAAAGGAAPSAAPVWSVAEFRSHAGLGSGTVVRLRGQVTTLSPCPTCPAQAQCKPCMPALNIAETSAAPLGESVRIQFPGAAPRAEAFQVGSEYEFVGRLDRFSPQPSEQPLAYVNYVSHEPN